MCKMQSEYQQPCTLATSFSGKSVIDEKGVERPLADVWAQRKVVAVFLRHLESTACKELTAKAVQLHDRLLQVSEDTAVVIFSVGRSEEVAQWREESGWEGELYLDSEPVQPTTEAKLLDDQSVIAAFEAAGSAGYSEWPGSWTFELKQSGGLFVLESGGACEFAFRSEYAGHLPPMDYVFHLVTGLFADGKPLDDPSKLAWNTQESDVEEEELLPPPLPSKLKNGRELRVYGGVTAVVGLAVTQFELFAGSSSPPLRSLDGVFGWRVVLMTAVTVVVVSRLILHLTQRHIRRSKLYTLGEVDRRSMELGIDDMNSQFIGGTEMEQEVLDDSPNKPKALVSAPQTSSEKDEITALMQLGCYVREFLAKPNFLVGRKGSTCPFIPTSLRRDTVYMVNAEVTAEHTVEDVKRLVREYVAKFESLEPRSGTAALYRTVLICMPQVPLHLCRRYIDQVQLELKGEVL
eukprot:Hpha_TRINITY_DN16931_c1_g2::TRINITY_DN16931_c1_g2_i6::g.53468::m.53468